MKSALSKSPHVVATVTQADDLEYLLTVDSVSADLLEYRLDNLEGIPEKTKNVINNAPVPALITARSPEEGGANDLSLEARLSLYNHFLDAAAIADTEIATLEAPEFSRFTKEAREMSTLVVGSYHNFDEWPGIDLIRKKVTRAFELDADIAKIAVVIDSMTQLSELIALVEEISAGGQLISAMGMGPLGKLSRLALARAGSCLNYGFLQTENAPGQWSAEELKRLITEI